MNQSIRRMPILLAIVALAAAVFAPQASAFGPPTFSFAFGTEGSGNGQFITPLGGIAFDKEGNAWIGDTYNSRIQKFNSKGEYLSQFGSYGTGNGQFSMPRDIVIDASGNLWVVDSDNNRIQKFNSKGGYLSQFGSYGTGNGQFDEPHGIAIDAQGNVWVTDLFNNRVQKFNSEGKYISQFGTKGTGNGQFEKPVDIDIDPAGDLWVADAINDRVQKFNSEGKYISQFGTEGSGNGQLKIPYAIAFGPEGSIWVTENSNKRVQAFNAKGEYMTKFGTTGSGPGQFSKALGYLAFDPNGDLWVGDSGNNRVQVWIRLWRIGGKTLAELGAKEATIVAAGTYKMEIPSLEKTINCTESSGGTISETNSVKETTTLNCKLAGLEAQCTYSPITLSFSGTAGKVTPASESFFLKTPGKTCPWFEGQMVTLPASFTVEVGTEAVQVPVNAYATGTFGGYAMYYAGSSTWELSGAYAGKTLGIW